MKLKLMKVKVAIIKKWNKGERWGG
jgi:hypothetical protein